MLCSKCAGLSIITQSRTDTIESKLRQHKCVSCKHMWWTVEVELPPNSIKWVRKEGTTETTAPIRIGTARAIAFVGPPTTSSKRRH